MRKFLPGLFLLAFASLALAAPSYDPNKPLDLRFTDIGSQPVDLSQMRGKVVLIDFWASSNQACRQNESQVVTTYKKYHDQGFNIIGISYDHDKGALLSFIQSYGMFWPQYYDGQGKKNLIGSRFGVDSIPTMWLIDQKGMVVSTHISGDDLAGQVRKLLKVP